MNNQNKNINSVQINYYTFIKKLILIDFKILINFRLKIKLKEN